MKEYEIVAKFCNACAGSSRPQTFFDEAELENTDEYVRMKHSRDFSKFSKEGGNKNVFFQVQDQIEDRRRQMKDGKVQIFSGLVKCSDCG